MREDYLPLASTAHHPFAPRSPRREAKLLAPVNRLVTRIGMGGSANLLTVPAVAYELVGVLETVLLLGGGLWPARTRFFLAQWNHTKCEGANPLQLGGGELWTLTN